jgi:hypothetical protein
MKLSHVNKDARRSCFCHAAKQIGKLDCVTFLQRVQQQKVFFSLSQTTLVRPLLQFKEFFFDHKKKTKKQKKVSTIFFL